MKYRQANTTLFTGWNSDLIFIGRKIEQQYIYEHGNEKNVLHLYFNKYVTCNNSCFAL
jgi:hypothetical protein